MTTVLVVLDDPSTRNRVTTVLQCEHYAVVEATTFQGALTCLCESARPMVALVEFWLPDPERGSMKTMFDLIRATDQPSDVLRRHAYILLTSKSHVLWQGSLSEKVDIRALLVPFTTDGFLSTVASAAQRITQQ